MRHPPGCGNQVLHAIPSRRQLLGADGHSFQNTQLMTVHASSQIRAGCGTATKLIDEDAGADAQGFRTRGAQDAGLKGCQAARLNQRINPDGIKGGKIVRQPTHSAATAAQVTARRQLILGEQPLQLFRGWVQHDAGVLSR